MRNNNEETEITDIMDVPAKDLHIVHYRKPYTYHRICRILRDIYDCRLEKIWQGYKANRRPGYVEIYRVIQNYDNEVVFDGVQLDTLRKVFANEDYPLYDEKSQCNQKKPARNKNAEIFLEAAKNHTK